MKRVYILMSLCVNGHAVIVAAEYVPVGFEHSHISKHNVDGDGKDVGDPEGDRDMDGTTQIIMGGGEDGRDG